MQIDRLLDSDKFNRFVEIFADGWIGVNVAGEKLKPESIGLSQVHWDGLRSDMKTETVMCSYTYNLENFWKAKLAILFLSHIKIEL